MLKRFHFRFLVFLVPLLVQQNRNNVGCQSFAEIAAVKYRGRGGAGSILPYSSTRRAAGNRGEYVDPRILHMGHGTRSTSGAIQGPVFVGPRFNTSRPSNTGPVFHYVLMDRPSSPGSFPGGGGGGGVLSGGDPASGTASASGGDAEVSGLGGGRLIDPPNRSSLWREGVKGAAVNLQDDQLNCGADHMPIMNSDADDMGCGVCGDSPIGLPNHVLGGRYVGFAPTVSRAYVWGQVIPVKFLLNHTIIPGMDRVTFSLCPIRQRWTDVTKDCLSEAGRVQVVGWGDAYLPSGPGEHRVLLRLPRGLVCPRCVLQWHWQTSRLASKQVCARQPWLRSCYRLIEYVNCADISIRGPVLPRPSTSSSAISRWTRYLLLSGMTS